MALSALDHNYPMPIIGQANSYLREVELVPIGDMDSRLPEEHFDFAGYVTGFDPAELAVTQAITAPQGSTTTFVESSSYPRLDFNRALAARLSLVVGRLARPFDLATIFDERLSAALTT